MSSPDTELKRCVRRVKAIVSTLNLKGRPLNWSVVHGDAPLTPESITKRLGFESHTPVQLESVSFLDAPVIPDDDMRVLVPIPVGTKFEKIRKAAECGMTTRVRYDSVVDPSVTVCYVLFAVGAANPDQISEDLDNVVEALRIAINQYEESVNSLVLLGTHTRTACMRNN